MIQIKRNNKVFFTLEDFGEGSKLSYQLMDHHYIILKFTTATPVYFEIGDSVEIPDFGYFELTSSYFPKHNDSDGYDYEMQMDAYYMSWKNKICKYRPQHGANETSFNLTTTVGVHMNVILGNLKALGLTYNGKEFSVDYTTYNNKAFDVQKRFLIEYGSISILDALNSICSEDALNCEWWIDGSIIYLGYCEMEGQTTFEQNVNVLSMSYSESKSTYITRLYAFGSDRNIPKGYFTGADADVTTDGVATDYLMLPNKEVDSDGFYAKDGYLENVNVVKNDKQAIEGVVMFEDEYPKVECRVSRIKTYDSTVDNDDGTKTTQTFWQVGSMDSFAENFEASWIKSNLTLGIKFTSGALMGMEFDVSFKIIDKENFFEIVANDTYGRTLPDNVMCPKEGDRFFLFNWDATKITDTDLIPTAQLSLFDRAKQYYQKTMISNSNFTCTMDGDKFYNDGTYDYHPLGEQVKLINDMFAQVDADGKHYRNSRIIGMEIPLDIPYDHPQYTVGEKAATSRLGKLEDKVDSIKVNGMQIGGTGSGNGGVYVIGLNDSTPASDSNVYSARRSRMEFISRLQDNTAKGTITWEKVQKLVSGLLVGNFNNENGGSWTPDTEGRSHLITDYLEVRMKAIFEELVIKKTSTIGGKEIISPAGGVVAHKVEEVTVTYNNVSQKAYRCYFLAEQEGDAVDNDFAIGDQVRSESFNVRKGTYHKVGNHFYWRLVIGRDEEPVELEGKKYHYIDLSDTDCATASDVPAKGDVLSQCGNRTDVERQNCLIFSAVDTYSPSISLYHGINSYSFANREYVEYGVNKQTNKAFFNVYGDMYVGDRPTKENGYEGSSYIKYDSAAKQVSVKGKISAKSTVDGKELSQYIKENSAKGLTEEQVNNLIKNSQVITDLQNQVDGAIETWFYEGVPTLNNAPASSWTTDKDKDTHLGDLYYDNKTGKAYRFAKDGNTYKWTIITDTDIAKALSDASKAQETADGKMKVFSDQPIPPYQLGDIWVNATYPTDGSIYKNEILRCQTAKAKDSSFAIADWTKASKYTDDSALNSFKEEYKNDMTSYKEQLDEKVETWFYNYAPTTQNKPASDWTTDTLKSQHAGDLFYNTSNGYTYRWTGTAWARIKDNDINTAMTAASKAQDTADGKRTVFTSQPTIPYDEGDLWASGGDDGKTLMVCVKSRATGSFTSSEWVKANDSDLNAFAKTIEESLTGIRDQLDKKAETWYQATDPSTSWTTDDAKKEHKGDLWYNTSNNQTFFWNGTKWDKQDVPTEVFDKIDGKSSIYVSKPASYEERDLWILEAAYTLGGVAYSKGELVVATKSNASFSAADWTKKVKYTDDTVANAAKKAAEEAKKAADTAQTNVTNLGKTVTSNKKAFDNYVTDGYLEPSEIAAMAQDSKRLEDAFAAAEKSYNEVKGAEVLKSTKELTDLNTAFTTLSTAKTELVTYLSDISTNYNKADTNGKATIVSAVGTKFTNFQSAYSAFYDKLGLANAYITSKIYSNLGVVIGDVTSLSYLKKALMDAPDTEINGGLILTSLIGLRDTDGNTTAGINGITEKSAKGGGIAAWFGGEMVDKDYNDGSKTPANTIFRFDGSGYVAGGAIWWGTDGRVHADPTSFVISEKNLGAYLTFFEPTWKSGSAGTSVADLVSLKPNAPFSKLGVSGDATFEGAISFHGIKLTYDATNKAIKIDGNLYATGGITAYGAGTSTSGGGGLNGSVKSYSDALKLASESLSEVASAYSIKALSRRIDNISSELGGLSLDWANITGKPSTFTPSAHTHKWVDITDRITKVSQLTNDSGYTTNKGTVTSVKLTLPTGLSLGTTKEITTSGTFAISLTSGYSIPTTSKQGQWDSAYNWYKLMTTDEETADGVINKWNEVVDFLAGIAQTDSLDSILSGINKSITDETNRAKKAEGANATNIATNKANITTLQGYFTNGSAKSAIKLTNARKLWGNSFDGTADISGSIVVPSGKYITIGNIKLEYDATNKALKITNTSTNEVANLYTSGGVSAYGVGTTSSGSTGGGGLNGTVKSYNDAKSLTSESLSEVASAYSVAALYSSINDAIGRINTLEGGSATSIEVTGSGNAVTGVSKSGTKLTFTKGATFLTSHQDISGKSDKTHTHSVKINGITKTIAATGGTAVDLGTYLTSHQSLAAYLKSADAEKTYSKLGHTHAFNEITGKPTTLAGYGVTDGVNAVSVTGNGNAVTSASIDGHTLTLTKGSTFSLSGHTHTFASLTSKPTTIAGYGITDAYTKAQVDSTIAKYLPLAGGTITGALTVNGIATFKSKVAIGDIYIINDGSGNLYVQKTDGKTAANFYATGGITAYGAGTSTSGGGGLNASVISYARIIEGSYTDADLTSIPNAYAIKALSSRIDNIATELGGLSLSWNNITGKPSTFAPSAHTHKWAEITDRITKVSQLTNDAGYLTAHQSLASYYTKAEIDAKGYTTNKGTVTSVALTLPTGLTCATKTITTSGTFAISLASGYSIPTTAKQTAWDGAVSAKHTHSNKSVLDGISSTKVSHWDSAYGWYALMTTDEETADGVINKWNEVVSFLANIAQTNTLSGIVDGINKSISDEVTRAKKAEGVNASGISANKGSIATLQGYFTNGSAKKALQLTNARKLWGNSFNGTADINGSIIVPSGKYISIGNIKLEYDAANKALKITNTTTEEVANLYTSGGVSAYGVGASSSSGGGLNGSVKAYADAIRLTTENLSEVASAYSVAKLYSEIQNVASAVPSISVSVPTGGNALTGATYDASTGVITFAKGTFLTAHQSLDGYVNAIAVSGSGNAVTAVTKSGKTITFTKGATYLTSHQSLSNYYTKSSVDSLLNGKSATTHTHSVKINGITKTIAASGGDAVDLGTYLTAHQSLAAYATQNWVKNEATAHNADMVDNYHASGLFTGFSISDVANKVTISIGGTSKALNLVRAFPSGVGNNFNDIATHGNSMGMSNIAAPYASSTANYQTLNGYVNPNGQTGWHHYINLSYTDSNNTATSPSMWQTQFAIKAGTTEVYVRSRAGGKISNDAAWVAPWVRLARVTDNVASASKVANALSWSGYSSGSYNGSAVKSISIPNNTNQLTNGAGFITSSASITGNAGSATKLQNARTINGTSFNGTANIVTSYWGTTRKLWGNSVNGNADVNGSITIANTDGVYVQIGDVRLVYDKANTAIKVVKSDGTTAANFYATGGITAYGEGSGSSGGGGLNGSVKSYADALKLASESLSEIASAYSIKQLSTRITSLEGGSATSISVSGGGNAVTSVAKNGTTISVVKGSTFLTAHQSLAGYMETATADAKYMYHSRSNIVSDLNSFATDGAAHIYEMNNVTNRPNRNSWVQVMNWGTGDSDYGFLLANDYSTNGHMYFRQKIAGSWKDWKTIIDSSNIGSQSVNYAASAGSVAWTNVSGRPSTMKNPSALSWSGYSSGSYDGSAAKSISIPNNTNQLTNGAGFITASASITGNAATATKVNHSLSVFGKSFNGSADVTVADTDLIASISTATANLTDKTEILTSYASDNGFNDSNAKNRIYRRPASAIWGYINSKTISNADKLDNVHLNGIFTALSNTNNGVSMTIGTVAKSLANMQVYSATKLVTARNIALNGDLMGNANFDGSANITINGYMSYCNATVGNTNTYPWRRIAKVNELTGNYSDGCILLYISEGFNGGYYGIARVYIRTDNLSTGANASCSIQWISRNGYGLDSLKIAMYKTTGKAYYDVFLKMRGTYASVVIRTLQDQRGGLGKRFTLVNSTETTNAASHTEAYATIEDAATAIHNQAYTSIAQGSDVATVHNADMVDGIHASGLFTNLSNSGNSLSITVGGTNKTLTVNYASNAGNADTLDGVHASGLFTNLSNSGNNISITIGGTSKTLTAAYATNCDTVDGYHAQSGSSKPYGKIPVIGTDGVIELGHYIDFHHDNTTGSEYSVRLQTNGNHSNVVTLPTATGTLALKSDNVASATKLQTARTIWGQSFNGTANISGSMTGVGDITLDAGARIKHGSGNLYIGNSDNSNWIGVQDICSQSSIGDGNWSLRTSGAAHFKDTTINGTATIKNLLSLVDGSHKGLKMGSTYISSLDGEVILQGNTALRFGNDAWDYDQWAGLKYDHSSKTVYLGIADGSIFKANSAQSGGVINLKQGISSVYTPALYAGGDIYHTGVYRMLWKNSKASKYLNVMNISQDDNGILTIGYGNFSNNKNVVLEGYNLNFRVGNDSGMKSMWLNYNNGNPVLSLDGNFYATGGVTAYKSSDERLKHDIHGVDSLAIIKAMGGTVSFRYNADNKDSIGWIAQRVLHNTFMQDLVEKDDKGFLKINYWSPKLIAVAFGAIEQVDDEVSRLKARVVFLESEVQRLSGKQGSSDKKRLDNKNINLLN